jgi:hypothetical protein
MRSRFTKVFPVSIHDDDDGVRRAKCLYELVEIRSMPGTSGMAIYRELRTSEQVWHLASCWSPAT